MFLNDLKENNKEGFLKLCVHAALSNGVFADEEKTMLSTYCREMSLEVHIPETTETFEELLKELNQSTTQKERNIIVLETLALIKSDGIYDDKEQAFMKALTVGLGVSEVALEKLDNLLNKYIEVGKELYVAIVG